MLSRLPVAESNVQHNCASFAPVMARPQRPESLESIGRRLRLIRLAFGAAQGYEREMSQAEIARRTGISHQAWNNAETGDNRIGLDNAMLLCGVTGASLDYIYFGNRAGLPHALAIEIDKLVDWPKPAKRA